MPIFSSIILLNSIFNVNRGLLLLHLLGKSVEKKRCSSGGNFCSIKASTHPIQKVVFLLCRIGGEELAAVAKVIESKQLFKANNGLRCTKNFQALPKRFGAKQKQRCNIDFMGGRLCLPNLSS